MHGFEVNDLSRVVGADGFFDEPDVLAGGGFAQQQGLGLDREHGGDGHQQQTDHGRASRVPETVAGQQGQTDAE